MRKVMEATSYHIMEKRAYQSPISPSRIIMSWGYLNSALHSATSFMSISENKKIYVNH